MSNFLSVLALKMILSTAMLWGGKNTIILPRVEITSPELIGMIEQFSKYEETSSTGRKKFGPGIYRFAGVWFSEISETEFTCEIFLIDNFMLYDFELNYTYIADIPSVDKQLKVVIKDNSYLGLDKVYSIKPGIQKLIHVNRGGFMYQNDPEIAKLYYSERTLKKIEFNSPYESIKRFKELRVFSPEVLRRFIPDSIPINYYTDPIYDELPSYYLILGGDTLVVYGS